MTERRRRRAAQPRAGPRAAARRASCSARGSARVADAVEDAVVDPVRPSCRASRVGSASRATPGALVLGRLAGDARRGVPGPRAPLRGRSRRRRSPVPTRTARALGAEQIVLTNAAGSLRAEIGPGRLMAITDHINLTGPTRSSAPTTTRSARASSEPGRRLRPRAARRAPATARRGARASTWPRASTSPSTGPSFETPAEIRAFRDARRRRRRHVDRPRGDRRASTAACASPPSRRSRTSPRAWSDEPLSTSRRSPAPGRRRRPARVLLRFVGAPVTDDLDRRALALARPHEPRATTTTADGDRRELCGQGGHAEAGDVAAVCVMPAYTGVRRSELDRHRRDGRAVANFPAGDDDPDTAPPTRRRTRSHAGATEVDVVVPWRAHLAGDDEAIARARRRVRAATGDGRRSRRSSRRARIGGRGAIRDAGRRGARTPARTS